MVVPFRAKGVVTDRTKFEHPDIALVLTQLSYYYSDLSSSLLRSTIIIGFSETIDTQLLLPVHIRQYYLPELRKTDAIIVNNLLENENENYQFLPINLTLGDVLKQFVDYKQRINVILDVGAVCIDGTNKDIAIKWLKLSNKNNVVYARLF
ncbi:unnamed protein product [Rotaria sp. Silwood2]|nr:unnamed protein product [Rotaria sp. Silwood2]CAF2760217.1 unnamed protein product [Rotaria sp. Silwood2]CAF4043370.1 unnamed protein product [Rotaria sp. Silwood2]CAF4177526.1 unnamed protein product [Rotaria sp. Silwood2]